MAIIDVMIPYEVEAIKKHGRVAKQYLCSDIVPIEMDNTDSNMSSDVLVYECDNMYSNDEKHYDLTDDGVLCRGIYTNNIFGVRDDSKAITISDFTDISKKIIEDRRGSIVSFYGYGFNMGLAESYLSEDNIKKMISDNREYCITRFKEHLSKLRICEDAIYTPEPLDKIQHFRLNFNGSGSELDFSVPKYKSNIDDRSNMFEFLPWDLDICFAFMKKYKEHFPGCQIRADHNFSGLTIDFEKLNEFRHDNRYLLLQILKKLRLPTMSITSRLDNHYIKLIGEYNEVLKDCEQNLCVDNLILLSEKLTDIYRHPASEYDNGNIISMMTDMLKSINLERDMSRKHINIQKWHNNRSYVNNHGMEVITTLEPEQKNILKI